MSAKRVAIIGAGFGGIATGIRLAARGYSVTIYEQRDAPGGRAYVYRQDGFTFDGGPTVITAPWLFRELFALAGRNLDEHIELVPMDPFYRIFFHDGERFDYSGDTERMVESIRELTGSETDVRGYLRFLEVSERIFHKGFTELATKPFLSPRDMVEVAPDLIRLRSDRTVYGLVAHYVRNERLRQILSFHPLLVGGNPFTTTSVYALIHHLEREWGVWFAMGGTARLLDALVETFSALGGEIRCNEPVERLIVSGNRATGLELRSGETVTCDLVVSNADVANTYRDLIPEAHQGRFSPRKIDRMRHSMSLFVHYFGTDRRYRDMPGLRLAHHNIILGPRYEDLLRDVFQRKVLAEDFSLYLHMPTLTDPSLAPPDGDAFYVLSPVPNLGGETDWTVATKAYRDRIVRFLGERFLPDLERHIVSERIIDPMHFRDVLGSFRGAAFSFEPVLTQSAYFRPPNRHHSLGNLYFAGAGTHPGAGLPGVLCSAVIADNLIAADHPTHAARPA